MMAPHVETRISISCDLTSFQLNRKIFKSNRKPNHIVSNQIFPSQAELPKWFKLRFKSQSRWGFANHCHTEWVDEFEDWCNQSINQSFNQYAFNSIIPIEHGYNNLSLKPKA